MKKELLSKLKEKTIKSKLSVGLAAIALSLPIIACSPLTGEQKIFAVLGAVGGELMAIELNGGLNEMGKSLSKSKNTLGCLVELLSITTFPAIGFILGSESAFAGITLILGPIVAPLFYYLKKNRDR